VKRSWKDNYRLWFCLYVTKYEKFLIVVMMVKPLPGQHLATRKQSEVFAVKSSFVVSLGFPFTVDSEFLTALCIEQSSWQLEGNDYENLLIFQLHAFC